jgi:hypothetical protein
MTGSGAARPVYQTGFDAARMEGGRILKIPHTIALEEEDRRVPTGDGTRT